MDLAVDAQGRLIVIWSSAHPFFLDVFARRLDESGAFLGDEFQINASTTGNHFAGGVAASPSGDLVVFWTSSTSNGTAIFARRFGPDGEPRAEYQLAVVPPLELQGLDVALDLAGNALVVWTNRDRPDHINWRMFDANDQPINEGVLNIPGLNRFGSPQVAYLSPSRFAVVWMDGPDGQVDLLGRLLPAGDFPSAIPALGPTGLIALILGLVFAAVTLLHRPAGGG